MPVVQLVLLNYVTVWFYLERMGEIFNLHISYILVKVHKMPYLCYKSHLEELELLYFEVKEQPCSLCHTVKISDSYSAFFISSSQFSILISLEKGSFFPSSQTIHEMFSWFADDFVNNTDESNLKFLHSPVCLSRRQSSSPFLLTALLGLHRTEPPILSLALALYPVAVIAQD